MPVPAVAAARRRLPLFHRSLSFVTVGLITTEKLQYGLLSYVSSIRGAFIASFPVFLQFFPLCKRLIANVLSLKRFIINAVITFSRNESFFTKDYTIV